MGIKPSRHGQQAVAPWMYVVISTAGRNLSRRSHFPQAKDHGQAQDRSICTRTLQPECHRNFNFHNATQVIFSKCQPSRKRLMLVSPYVRAA